MEPNSLQVGSDYAEGLISNMRTVNRKSPPQGDKVPGTAQRASLGHRLQQALRGGFRREPSRPGKPGGGGAGILVANRRPLFLIAFALMAALAVSLSLALVSAQATADTYRYTEGGTDPVTTFIATDPEQVTPIVWSVLPSGADDEVRNLDKDVETGESGSGADVTGTEVQDEAQFKISQQGVLEFKMPPDFENAADVDGNNRYQLVVVASDGGATEWRSWFKVTVVVDDKEETGDVAWTVDPDGAGTVVPAPGLRQFQAGAVLVASLTDPDSVADGTPTGAITAGVTWKWYRSESNEGPWVQILGQAAATYTASDEANNNDVGMYLRVEATYNDRRGGSKFAERISDFPVQAAKEDNSPPEFSSETATRGINEGPAGRDVGTPITATDADGDELNYTMPEGGDHAPFEIDRASGQISTDARLNFEIPTDADMDNVYVLEITATDSLGGTAPITVNVTVGPVNEAPMFGATPVDGMATDFLEDNEVLTIGTYMASDPEGGVVSLSLSGADSDKFRLAPDTDATPAVSRELSFIENPDFESRDDDNGDNIYEVTVEASDSSNNATRSARVKVTDADEDGRVTLAPQTATVGTEITATLEDSDGEVDRVRWEWEKRALDNAVNCAVATGNWEPIALSNADTYTPSAVDLNACLRAMAFYIDRTSTEDDVTDPTDDDPGDGDTAVHFENTAVSSSSTAVQDDPENESPEFNEGSATIRYVNENEDAGLVGDPVEATDDDRDTPVYSLSGTDMGTFDLNTGTGQLSTKTPLDHETDDRYTVVITADDGQSARNSTSRITVTIRVIDLDEAPKIVYTSDRRLTHEVTRSYEENKTETVATFEATDPERRTPILWSLADTADIIGEQNLDGVDPLDDVMDEDVADRALFDISDRGVLTFKESPDYENPPNAGDNAYQVVVQVSDGGRSQIARNWFKVVVNVTDAEDDEMVTWQVDPAGEVTASAVPQPLRQFRVGATLLPGSLGADGAFDDNSVGGGDGGIEDLEWKWYRSTSSTGGWSQILDAPLDGSGYLVRDVENNDDGSKYLRLVAEYRDARGAPKTAEFISVERVQEDIENRNTAPVLDVGAETTRRVDEGGADRTVGGVISGRDDDGDALTFRLTGTDSEEFKIDAADGQIKTAVPLNYEMARDGDTDNVYEVIVTAYDSSGVASNAVAVSITVGKVDEPPEFTEEATTLRAGMVDDLVENAEPPLTLAVSDMNTITATDPEGATVTLMLTGDDAGKFKFVELDPPAPNSKMVVFKERPDFEMPGDMDDDNVYEFTVRASDGGKTADLPLTVKVLDADEGGEVKLSRQEAVVGQGITATLTDSDSDADIAGPGRVARLTWRWQLADEPATGGCPAVDDMEWEALTGRPAIMAGAMTNSYTPRAADTGDCLRAQATYMDRTFDENNDDSDNTGMEFVMFMQTSFSMSTTPVTDAPENEAPEFEDGTDTVRYVYENIATAMDIGAVVMATDPDGGTIGSYTLGGVDMASFGILSATGQLQTKAPLDYEDEDTYTVMVTADDNTGSDNATASITVTIKVINVDERPVITASGGSMVIRGPSSASHPENSGGEVARYSVSGAGGETVAWSLTGTDRGRFSMDNGVVSFRSAPDYESKSSYTFTVSATVGGETLTRSVTVNVTNVDEPGVVTLSSPTPRVGIAITASLTDPDRVTGSASWQWASRSGGGSYANIPGATAAAYTPVAADEGSYLRATASYTDGEGPRKSADDESDNVAAAGESLVDRYDANDNNVIDRGEVLNAINDYLFGTGSQAISKAEVLDLIRMYLFPN